MRPGLDWTPDTLHVWTTGWMVSHVRGLSDLLEHAVTLETVERVNGKVLAPVMVVVDVILGIVVQA